MLGGLHIYEVEAKQKLYFDSGSSKHMTSNREFLTNLQPCNLEFVTFGDGAKGSGYLKVPSMPKLENDLLVNGIKVNLIIISQLCDQNLFVKFTKYKCLVINNTNTCVREGKKIIKQLLFVDLFEKLLQHLVKQLKYLE